MGRQLICLTPVKDEAWILDRFIRCASKWADVIIIADQSSSDDSREIARSFEKVRLIENPSMQFNEPERQKLLIDEARKIPGDNVLIALDADEVLTGNFSKSPEWHTAINSAPGTVLEFFWTSLYPDMRKYWLQGTRAPFGYVDDGAEHIGTEIHSHRIPYSDTSQSVTLNDVGVMHYQYTDTERMQSKHRWYLAWEWLNGKNKSPLGLYRMYHHMNALNSIEYKPIPPEWMESYTKNNIDMTSIRRDNLYRWDRKVLEMIAEHGNIKFRRLPIWDTNWKAKADKLGFTDLDRFTDPRSFLQTRFHYWLGFTQANARSVRMRVMDEILKLVGF